MHRSALVLIVALLCSVSALPAAAARPGPRVLRDVQAGIDRLEPQGDEQPDTALEPSISVNPNNPLNAVAVYQAGRVDSGCAEINGYATTVDGGKTWRSGAFPKLTVANGGTTDLASDPAVAFGPGNIVYTNHLMCATTNDLAFSVSRDGGRTWGTPIPVPSERTFPLDDKNWIAVDNGKGPGHHNGRLYMVWDDVAPVVALYSDDQAKTWNGPFVIWPGQGIGTYPLVMPNGDLAIIFTGAYPVPPLFSEGSPTAADLQATDKFLIARASGAGAVSTGGPLVFTPATPIASNLGVAPRDQRAGDGLPAPAVDPKTGRIYVAWMDHRFRSDVVNDVVMTYSDDGTNWSAVRRVNPGPTGDYAEHFTPAIEVGRDRVVRIMYRVQKQAANLDDIPTKTPYVDTFYQQTKDGSRFSVPMKVNTRVRSDIRFAAYSRGGAFYGDYSQIAVTGSWAYVVRAESFRVRKSDKAQWPPVDHHQRVWVAVVDSDGNGRP